ncbi:DUF6498-containing protein [Halorussus sp. AFM4]|uniref:DUF6498-containing protein n=1 Tax=Halorussus sp. AFM4 TaxID=3421651 RepID=UPI003EBFC1E1
MAPSRRASSPFAVAALLAANLLPLAGVLWWDWSVFEVLLLYWLESGVVGAFNVPKILLAEGTGTANSTGDSPRLVEWEVEGVPTEWFEDRSGPAGRAGLAGFFVLHYGIFWAVHGVFVFALPLFAAAGSFGGGPFGGSPFGGDPLGGLSPGVGAGRGTGASPVVFVLAVGSMVLSHGVSFAVNYLRGGEYRTVSPAEQMMRPYGRVTVLHLTIVFGAFLVAALGSPLPALVLLVALKTALDLGAHLREHRRSAPRPTQPDGDSSGGRRRRRP